MQARLPYTQWTGSKELLARLVPQGSRVLDIGCATGVFGAELARRKRGLAIGLEIDERSAAMAARHYEKVFVGDAQELFELPGEYSRGIDVLVFGDVLEHMTAPEAVLRHYQRYLKTDGIVLVSIPNVANWLNRLRLLAGRWEYRECGILDRTHLRFYTYATARRLLEDAGLRIERVVCTSGLHAFDFKAGFHNPANIWKSLLAFQFIFVARAATGDAR